MLTPVYLLDSRKAARRRKREAKASHPPVPPPPPPALNQIIAVQHGDDGERCTVALSQPIVNFMNLAQMFRVSEDGVAWQTPVGFHDGDPTNVEFVFAVDVSDATLWEVPEPANWIFAASATLAPPLSGSFE